MRGVGIKPRRCASQVNPVRLDGCCRADRFRLALEQLQQRRRFPCPETRTRLVPLTSLWLHILEMPLILDGRLANLYALWMRGVPNARGIARWSPAKVAVWTRGRKLPHISDAGSQRFSDGSRKKACQFADSRMPGEGPSSPSSESSMRGRSLALRRRFP